MQGAARGVTGKSRTRFEFAIAMRRMVGVCRSGAPFRRFRVCEEPRV